jgi:hypothetical protein
MMQDLNRSSLALRHAVAGDMPALKALMNLAIGELLTPFLTPDQVLDTCEAAARAEGFRSCELAATMGGEPLYRACGYHDIEPFTATTSGGVVVPLIRMGKGL